MKYLAASLCLMSLVGCGGGDAGPPRFQLSGTVTFDGNPVPNGMIVFEPDTSRNNKGPQGLAVIDQGKFDTSLAGGKGIVGGPMVVRITGQSSKGDPNSDEPIKALFENFELREEFPKSKSTKDFAVPKEAGDPKKDGPGQKRNAA